MMVGPTFLEGSKLHLLEHLARNTSIVVAHHHLGGAVKALAQTIADRLEVGQSHPTSLHRAACTDWSHSQKKEGRTIRLNVNYR